MYSVTHKIVHGTVETLCITLWINLTIHLIYLQIILQPSSVNCYNLSARRVSTIKNLNNFAAFKQSFFYKHMTVFVLSGHLWEKKTKEYVKFLGTAP